MVISVSVAIIAAAFVVLVVFLSLALIRTRQVLGSVKRDLHHMSSAASELMHRLDGLTRDLKAKSESLNCLFKGKPCQCSEEDHSDTMNEVVDWVSISLALVKKIRGCMRDYER